MLARTSSFSILFFKLCLSYCLTPSFPFFAPLPLSFFMPCLSCCPPFLLFFAPLIFSLFLACLSYYPSLSFPLSTPLVLLAHTLSLSPSFMSCCNTHPLSFFLPYLSCHTHTLSISFSLFLSLSFFFMLPHTRPSSFFHKHKKDKKKKKNLLGMH